jgi:membrane-bound lytic murein transglycosylase D
MNLSQSEYLKVKFASNSDLSNRLRTKSTLKVDIDSATYVKDWTINTPATFLNFSVKVADYARLYQRGSNAIYIRYLLDYYVPEIASRLSQLELPDFLAVIPAVSSGFDPFAVNALGGLGYWSLNYPQALKYGLDVNAVVDYRKDFDRSTRAALAYLADLKELYADWELALAAYACGPITVNNLLQRNGATTYREIYSDLPESNRDIVPAVAALYWLWLKSENRNVERNLQNLPDTVGIIRKMEFKAIEKVTNISEKELGLLNPVLNQSHFPDNFTAFLPKEKSENFKSLMDSIYNFQDWELNKPVVLPTDSKIPSDIEPVIYRVKSGDVLGRIAEKFGVRVSEIQDWNDLRTTRIDIGQELTIYSDRQSQKPDKSSKPALNQELKNGQKNKTTRPIGDYITYTVKSGDNLWAIARMFPGISAQNIMDLNGINENLQVGQVLKIKLKE